MTKDQDITPWGNGGSSCTVSVVDNCTQLNDNKNINKQAYQNYSSPTNSKPVINPTPKAKQVQGRVDQIANYLSKKLGLDSYSTELLERNWELGREG